MGQDYYSVLGVHPMSTEMDIARRFRLLALTYHPAKHVGQMAKSNFLFSQICEAYEVLSDKRLRGIYDQFGEEVLKSGLPDKEGLIQVGYRYSGNSYQIFEKFFGTKNPFVVTLDEEGNQIGALKTAKQNLFEFFGKKFKDLQIKCEVTLEEFFYGCQKEILFQRVIIKDDQKSQAYELARKTIEILPGMGEFTELTFPGEGHHWFGTEKSDLKVKFMLIPHEKFKRFHNDLVYYHKLTLVEALKCTPVHFVSLDGEQIQVAVDEIISPETTKVLPGKGMPILNNDPLGPLKKAYQRGNLVLKFDVQFPKYLSAEQKDRVTEILNEQD